MEKRGVRDDASVTGCFFRLFRFSTVHRGGFSRPFVLIEGFLTGRLKPAALRMATKVASALAGSVRSRRTLVVAFLCRQLWQAAAF